MNSSTEKVQPLTGLALFIGASCLAMANFLAILDTTIANVSIANIAGSLGVSTSQGTYVITSYAVAEAISVPLTGWLSRRFGSIRVFVTCLTLFGLFSILCGMATSMSMLVVFRVLLGLSGGPLMPLSQTLMIRIFPKEKSHAAIGIWSMTTLIAPIMGPILGGYLCDEYSWHYIFVTKAPFAIVAAFFCWRLLNQFETPLVKSTIDKVGLLLLVVWVGALQLMLDEGKDLDWFESTHIQILAIVALIGFVAFLIWELTERNPVVDLRIFRHRGYSVSMVTLSMAFGGIFRNLHYHAPLATRLYGLHRNHFWVNHRTHGYAGRISCSNRCQYRQQTGSATAGVFWHYVAWSMDAISEFWLFRHDLRSNQLAYAHSRYRHAVLLCSSYGHCSGVRERG